jgi:hypothetical protein
MACGSGFFRAPMAHPKKRDRVFVVDYLTHRLETLYALVPWSGILFHSGLLPSELRALPWYGVE